MAKKRAKKAAKKHSPRKKKVARKKSAGKRKSGLTQQKHSLSAALQEVVKGDKMSRPEIVKRLWAYIKAHKCQDTKNRRMICPDKKLAEVIGNRPVDMMKLAGHISKHIRK